jgi:carbamoyltransferase
MFTLGINAAFHDCSACLVKDGVVLAAAEEERFTRIKHGKRPVPFTVWQLPFHAIAFCLERAGIAMADVDHVAYAYDPWPLLADRGGTDGIVLPLEPSAAADSATASAPWEALALAYIVNAPRQLAGGAPHHLRHLFGGLAPRAPYRWHFVDHHRAHEASACLAAPFDEGALLVMDGRGERACTSYGVFRGGMHRRIKQVDYPHSLGLLYEEVTAHLGFLHSSDEYKVMALASYGNPRFLPRLRELVRYCGAGEYRVERAAWDQVLGPPRRRGEALTQDHLDAASSLQAILEETVLRMTAWLHRETGAEALCMAGGVALNCVLNSRIRDQGLFRDVWVQPAAGDAGTALGAALEVDARERGGAAPPQLPQPRWRMDSACLGPAFSELAIEDLLREARLAYRRVDDIVGSCAALLADGQVLGWFQGSMEFGPRALGARSILASPLDPLMQDRLNRIKDREDFRPVAPAVPEEDAADWFADGRASPFMLFVDRVRPDRAARIPAVRHVDGTARIQTVARRHDPLFHALLRAFGERTGVPVLINTSFNTRGAPIVCTPRDALESFCTTALDALAIGPFLLEKRRLLAAEAHPA